MTRARVRSLLAATLIAAGTVTVSPAADPEPAEAYVGLDHVDCGQSWQYAHRVCYDTGQGWFHIYTTAPYQQPNLSFPSNTGYGGQGRYVGQVGLFNVSNNGCGDEAVWNGGVLIGVYRYLGNCQKIWVGWIHQVAAYDGSNRIAIWGDNFRFLVWYLSVPGYDLMITRD